MNDPTIDAKLGMSDRHYLAEFRPHLKDRMQLQELERIPIAFTVSELDLLLAELIDYMLNDCTDQQERMHLQMAWVAMTEARNNFDGQ